MNSKTKIVVIRMKELIIGAIIAVAVIVLLIFIIMSMTGKTSAGNSSGSASHTTGTSAKTTSTSIANTYTPGVYTSSITLNGNPVDVQVTVDKDNINSIQLVNVSDAITTMYPMIQSSFDELSQAVIASGSTKNITYSSDNKYTSNLLLNAIAAALDKCTVK
jgi:uncharacterized protein with FMN-binding domain